MALEAIIDVGKIFGITTIKVVLFIAMIFLANRWAEGSLKKPLTKLKDFKKTYGIGTVLLIVLWWLLTPSGSVDDIITLWLINNLGITIYIITIGILTAYLIWKLRITIIIYKKK